MIAGLNLLCRGKGLAKLVIQAAMQEGLNNGHTRMLISCALGNSAALALYQKIGFVVVGQAESETSMRLVGSSGFIMLQYQATGSVV